MSPQPGDIGLVSIPGWSGPLIRVGQFLLGDGFSKYEHAFIVGPDGRIIEAEPGGARHVPFHYDPATVCWLRCPDEYRDGVSHAALRYVGVPYSFADYAALAALRLDIPSHGLREYVKSSDHMICSQLADQSASDGGWHIFGDGRLPQDVTPGDLWQVATQQPVTA